MDKASAPYSWVINELKAYIEINGHHIEDEDIMQMANHAMEMFHSSISYRDLGISKGHIMLNEIFNDHNKIYKYVMEEWLLFNCYKSVNIRDGSAAAERVLPFRV